MLKINDAGTLIFFFFFFSKLNSNIDGRYQISDDGGVAEFGKKQIQRKDETISEQVSSDVRSSVKLIIVKL